MNRLTFKQRQWLQREQEILRAAAHLIREHGYSNVSMDEIATEVGVSKPTLYQHFRRKDDMIAATMIRSMQEMDEFIVQMGQQPVIDKLAAILRHMLEQQHAPEHIPAVIVQHHVIEALDTNEDVIAYRNRVGEHLFRLVAEGKAHGEIALDVDDTVVIGSMFALLHVLEGPKAYRHPDPAPLIDSIVNMFVRGIRNPQAE